MKDKGLEFIGVAFDENGQEAVPPFMKAMGINYQVYLDGGDIAQKYDLQAYPTTLVYGKDGKVASKYVGYVSEKEFEDELSNLLKK
ncbi:MAG: TlpA family protein disulfide reductase, partial [Candidatus Brocadia sp.]